MIEISKVTKKYGKNIIVNNLSLKIKAGSIFGFLGPNGAGKTTTIKMLTGLNNPDIGEITIDGINSESISAKRITGYMPEDPYFYDHLTGYEFLELCLGLSTDKKPDHSIIKETLDKVGLEHAFNQAIDTYSKGMKQRLGLGQAIIHRPKYIFLDEPLDGLDPIGRNDFKKIMKKLKEQKSTIFLNSHILADVEELCDEIGIIHKGNLLYSGKVNNFCKKNELEKEFVQLIEKSK